MKQQLLKITAEASTSSNVSTAPVSAQLASRKKRPRVRRQQPNSPASQRRLREKFMAVGSAATAVIDTDDSDVEFIECEQKSAVVVLDDDEDECSAHEPETKSDVLAKNGSDEQPQVDGVEPMSTTEVLSTDNTSAVIQEAAPEVVTSNQTTSEPSTMTVDTPNDSNSFSAASTDLDILALKTAIENDSAETKTSDVVAENAISTDDTIPPVASAITKFVAEQLAAEPAQANTSTPVKVLPSYAEVLKSTPIAVAATGAVSLDDAADNVPPLFFDDKHGSIDNDIIAHVPMYDPISDDSFICDKTMTPVRAAKVRTHRNSTPAIIDLDQTIVAVAESPAEPTPKQSRKRKRTTTSESTDLDDSVIFVSETLSANEASLSRAAMNFISIKSKSNKFNSRQPKNARGNNVAGPSTQNQRVFQRSVNNNRPPTAVATVSSNNTYNPSKLDTTKSAKRMVIIDGSNVAFSHSTNHQFSVRGIAICIEFFEREGHVVKAVLPQMRLKQRMSTDPVLLETLHKQGKVVLTPCKNLPGRNATSYDDRFIMDLAVEFDAAIVSNDNFRDLFMENEQKYSKIIESRVIGYTWCMDMILFPKDPYGRGGPTLDDILNRKC